MSNYTEYDGLLNKRGKNRRYNFEKKDITCNYGDGFKF